MIHKFFMLTATNQSKYFTRFIQSKRENRGNFRRTSTKSRLYLIIRDN